MKSLSIRSPFYFVSVLLSLAIVLGYSWSRFVPTATAAPPTTFIVFNTNDAGAGSLRQAIISANANPGLDTINFNLPVGGSQTLTPGSPLPVITDPVIIDGYSQFGTSQNSQANGNNAVLTIEIDGTNVGVVDPCMSITAGGSTVRGLVINRCRIGIRLETLGGNTIQGNFFGTDPTGNTSLANTTGVDINNSSVNTIGGVTPAARNLISGATSQGILIRNAGSTGNIVAGNFIGTNASGTDAVGNSIGISISSASNTIGGTTAGARNIISGNSSGVVIGSVATLNVVQGNYIGLNALANAALQNVRGVVTQGNAENNLIGGTVAGARNVISGNFTGMFLGSTSAGVNTRVEGNLIGTDPAGTASFPNDGGGVIVLSSSNIIGGTTAGAGNVIVSNGVGVIVDFFALGNPILGNSIFANGPIGIDLNGDFVTSNDEGDSDTGGNNLQNYPVLTSATSVSGGATTVGGTLNSTPNSSFRIEFFFSPVLSSLGFGQGRTFIGSTTVTTDGTGNASFMVNTLGATPTGQFITATATNNTTNDTSEFSAGAQINGPETFKLSAPTFTVSENAGVAKVTVTRTNGVGGGSTVNFATSPALALSDIDFAAISGTVTFGVGETIKTITIPIIDDTLIEGDEFFSVAIFGSSIGTTVSEPSFADVFIADREQTIYGVTFFNNLIAFERANPSTLYSRVPITGVQPGERILGIDFRPSTGVLYGLGNTSRLYTIDTTTGVATEVGVGPFSPALSGTDFGFDFNPVVDRIRVVSNTDQNFRLDPDTGAVIGPDTTLAYEGSDPNAAADPNVTSLAYTNNTAGATSTTLYGIDSNLDALVRVGSPGGTPTSPNSGQLFTVGTLGSRTFNFGGVTGFDILSSNDTALAALTPPSSSFFSILHEINLTTGEAVEIFSPFSSPLIGGFTLQEAVRGIAIATNGNIGFASATTSVSEGAGKVQITLTRTGDISGAASVDFTTTDGTAVQTSDYNIGFGTVTFAPNEASKSFSVFITDDGYMETGETFTVSLANAQGGFQVGGITGATVTIADNDVAPSVINPIEGAPFFVRQHYIDFLNREPDTSGFNFWVNEITSCGSDVQCIEIRRVNVSAAFFLSIEFQRTGALVYLTHKAAVGSNFPGAAPVPVLYSQFEHDRQTIQKDLIFGQPNFELLLEINKQAFLADFVSRTPFELAFPNSQTPTEFVDALIANTGVAFSAEERSAAINEFFGSPTSADPAARVRALRRIVENPTFAAAEFNRTFVAMEYFGYLRRDPDAAGFTFWLNKLDSFNGNFVEADMVKSFINSSEYRERFGAN
jgi:Domain of unknown function (DUF4394)/Calx-beta domain/Domain of unknown function (DUF4214)